MIEYDKLMSEIEQDSDIDLRDLKNEILKVPKLISKYLRYHKELRQLIARANSVMNELIVSKQQYYSGQADASEYRKKPFNFVIKNQGQLERYLEGDIDINSCREKMTHFEEMLFAVREMIDGLKYRPNHLTTIHNINVFQSGG